MFPSISNEKSSHCVKSVRIRSYSGPFFPTFGLNTDQINSEYGHFSRSEYFDRKPWIWIEKPVISMEYDCHIFSKYLRISNEKPSISIEILGISNQKF